MELFSRGFHGCGGKRLLTKLGHNAPIFHRCIVTLCTKESVLNDHIRTKVPISQKDIGILV
jgi:hypothetical protein